MHACKDIYGNDIYMHADGFCRLGILRIHVFRTDVVLQRYQLA